MEGKKTTQIAINSTSNEKSMHGSYTFIYPVTLNSFYIFIKVVLHIYYESRKARIRLS
jgi:hypothetical protein